MKTPGSAAKAGALQINLRSIMAAAAPRTAYRTRLSRRQAHCRRSKSLLGKCFSTAVDCASGDDRQVAGCRPCNSGSSAHSWDPAPGFRVRNYALSIPAPLRAPWSPWGGQANAQPLHRQRPGAVRNFAAMSFAALFRPPPHIDQGRPAEPESCCTGLEISMPTRVCFGRGSGPVAWRAI